MIAISHNDLYERKLSLFDLNDPKVKKWTVKWWNKITTDREKKRNSKLAKYGRSKEKHNDERLIVLALVVNSFGFIKYSYIHEGNFADSVGLEKVIDQLDYAEKTKAPIVVIDAGIATEANLQMIRNKGCHYLCVSQKILTDYPCDNSRLTVK